MQRLLLLGLLLAAGCSPARRMYQQLDLAEKEFHNHIGFVLYDPERQRTLVSHQADRYFIPASNTKIFTLFASLRLLGDSIPALRYRLMGDSVIVWGTGDPSFLYDQVLPGTRTLEFLAKSPHVFFSPTNFDGELVEPSWAWGDYRYAYQVERTPFPIYGNRYHMARADTGFVATPKIFLTDILRSAESRERHDMIRGLDSNLLLYIPGTKDSTSEWNIPFRYSHEFLLHLLSDTLKKEVRRWDVPLTAADSTLYSVPVDSVYRVMMQESDNFIAEQLMLTCAGVLSDTLRTEIAIREVTKRYLADLPDPPVWVDGSGLSRMNLFTPRSIVAMWEKLGRLVPRDRLIAMLAEGGVSGTLRNNYKAEKSYVFGKTGTLRNNHNLSGFVVTRRGKTLLFSWMNNNFTASTALVRKRMEEMLTFIYESY
jgi:D-alanyl-D-alanine carboxypeptidase/D-alanyl-D-alanine-endopeptidase (penicillin-binding protein 4)